MDGLEIKRFQRVVEDFHCEHCGTYVKGNGYTDHCPNCLWSRHVDNNPGDRACKCKGMMKPVSVIYYRSGRFKLNYVCTKCKAKKSVYSASGDNQESLERLINRETL
ncbi:RNHCP family predicted zinc binding protein [Candidatus Mancarchaeum acidiphilum]|uniref:RNHCP family predicted zinc binding protein n=1 Tax=Candidatus Mancarchaeum acidiphilum TaxID=1920749 RepID=A0A218NPB0_9ARCH|nr:RNHCP domain-containing protein [Candidatus Mancarchaeum acidiphilum]ASI14301.1 RNHCP family predicted zinc binding protein [Candidatus Mancarchaeum acidiphilum]